MRIGFAAKRAACIGLVAAGLAGALGIAVAKSPLTISGLRFPDKIAGAERGEPHEYEKTNPGLGHSVQYGMPGWAITVYIYDMGRTSIPDDPQSEVVKGQLDEARREVFQVRSKVEWKRDFSIGSESRRVRFSCGAFAYADKASEPLDGFVCLTAWKNKFVKFRLTTRAQKGSEAEATRFVRAWTGVLWPSRAPAARQQSASP
jgi:hypothetical protein